MTTPTYQEIALQMMKAQTRDALELAAQQIHLVGGFDEQNRLGYVFKARAAELKQ